MDSQNPDLYSIDNANQAVTTLNLDEPQAAGNVTVSLIVSNASGVGQRDPDASCIGRRSRRSGSTSAR